MFSCDDYYFDGGYFDFQTDASNDFCWSYNNGTQVFYNFTDPNQVDCSCVAPFQADPDTAGPGLLLKDARSQDCRPNSSTSTDFSPGLRSGQLDANARSYGHSGVVLEEMFESRSILQESSGYSLRHPTCYRHRHHHRRSSPRKQLVILPPTIVTTLRQWGPHGLWDPLTPGFCYLSHDTSAYSQNYLWIAGLICYAAYLIFILAKEAASSMVSSLKLETRRDDWRASLKSSWTSVIARIPPWLKSTPVKDARTATNVDDFSDGELFLTFAKWALKGIWRLVWSLHKQFIALWARGDIHFPLIVAAYFGFTAWNTYDLIDLKHSNAGLVPDETKWGFGLVLPVVLLRLIILNLMDALQGRTALCIPSTNNKLSMADARKEISNEKEKSSATQTSFPESCELQDNPSIHVSQASSHRNASRDSIAASQEPEHVNQKMVYQ
ncbi:hypothetical protein BDZ45DRAFT_728068 [Acephala macrosclerotiorum]|nr:hypothetical protein BDZ45DRAFT_728068 [Acephala macrosclerotiorum]